MTRPTVGRIVHYQAHGTPVRADGTQAYLPACRAAIVTEVALPPDGGPWPVPDDGRVGLAVLNPTGLFFHPLEAGGCANHEGTAAAGEPASYPGGTWHWPCILTPKDPPA